MSGLTRYKLTIEYEGTGLFGWQIQDNGPTVQGILQDAIGKFCRAYDPVENRTHAAGRTDAGVHALAMIVHVDLPRDDDPYKVMSGINFHLNRGPVVVLKAERVSHDFHARFSALKRYYRYHMINRPAPLTFQRHRAWQVRAPLDVEAMREAATHLVGHHDFTTFRSVECQSQSPVKTLDNLDIIEAGEHIYFDCSARSFLHHQVRSMVGCLYYVGKGKWTPDDMKGALEAADRAALGFNAPPDGLYFVKVDYPD
ncbi:tRNA pseudouridine(38-40) synthase TruA [Emcibacter sp.]|uniref:tRNA pseudouridine(38-40) synthase TruA n=1 Tax=Emcibacter sp. TaxID=1979954 RepID=UPI002AA77012|nr:tRNA pseudouridine(38-40) synthase TruA [Emcibacter sp.]